MNWGPFLTWPRGIWNASGSRRTQTRLAAARPNVHLKCTACRGTCAAPTQNAFRELVFLGDVQLLAREVIFVDVRLIF
jgi:hypothetical protein